MKNKEMMPIFIGVVAVLLVVLGIVIGVSVLKKDDKPSYEVNLPTETEEGYQYPDFGRKVETFVIMGVDSRENKLGAGSYSDAIMVVVLDHKAQMVRVASLLRDTMVNIEGHGYEKLTHANYYGGPELALQTIKNNFDLDVKDYIQLSFGIFEELVDALGGVEIELSEVEYNKIYSDRIKAPGKYLLTGAEALNYSRLRKDAGGDRARSERQRKVIYSLFEKVKTMPVDDVVEVAEEMIGKIGTSYREDEFIDLLYNISQYKVEGMGAFPLTYYDGLVGEVWHVVPTTLVDMNKDVYKFLYDYTEYVPSDHALEYSEAMKEVAPEPNTNYKEQAN